MIFADVGGNVVTNTFNDLGQRVSKETSTATTLFRYDHKNLLQEIDGIDDMTRSYTRTDEEYGDLISEHSLIGRSSTNCARNRIEKSGVKSTGTLEGGTWNQDHERCCEEC